MQISAITTPGMVAIGAHDVIQKTASDPEKCGACIFVGYGG
jgi:hypothetical protein